MLITVNDDNFIITMSVAIACQHVSRTRSSYVATALTVNAFAAGTIHHRVLYFSQ